MKFCRTLKPLLFLFVLFLFASCRDNDDLTFPTAKLETNIAIGQSIDFGTEYDYFVIKVSNSITTEGEGIIYYNKSADQNWISFASTENAGEFAVVVNRSGLDAGNYTGNVTITSKFGNQVIPIKMEVGGFKFTLNNTVYTPITVTVGGLTRTIASGSSLTFTYNGNPGSVNLSAYTYDTDASGNQIGYKLTWNNTYNVSGLVSKTISLYASSSVIYLKLCNTSSYAIGNLYINYDLGSSGYSYLPYSFPNNGTTYHLGYYAAYSNMQLKFSNSANTKSWTGYIYPTLTENAAYTIAITSLSKTSKLTDSSFNLVKNDFVKLQKVSGKYEKEFAKIVK